jgi:P-type Mg2+ transporter
VAWAPDLPEPGPAESAGPAGRAANRSAGAARPTGTALRGSRLSEYAEMPRLLVLRGLQSTPRGLVEDDAQARLARCGDNAVTSGRPVHWSVQLLQTARNPFALMLLGLDAVSAAIGDLYSTTVIGFLVAGSCLLRFHQERKSGQAAAALRALVATTATVTRRATAGAAPVSREVPVDQLVPGDIVELAPGDMIPADLRVLRSADLAINQAVLTGESVPAGKHPAPEPGGFASPAGAHPGLATGPPGREAGPPGNESAPLYCPWLCLVGGSVLSGSGTGIVVATGPHTYLGAAYGGVPRQSPATSFDQGVKSVSWTLIRFMLISVLLVLAVSVAARGHVAEAFLFVVSVAVGLTPEMLPVVVTAALARSARVMLRLGVIVKQLPAIHNLGAMDVLCTDKTGTLTDGHAALDFCVDARGRPDPDVLRWACLNSLRLAEDAGGQVTDPLDEALLKRAAELGLAVDQGFAGVEVIPCAFTTRCATVVLRQRGLLGAHLVITKGAPDEVLERCDQLRTAAGTMPLGPDEHAQLARLADDHAAGGVRLLAVATAEVLPRVGRYRPVGEAGLTLAGFVGFRDKPKDSAAAAVRALTGNGIEVKVVTGDHPLVAARACREVGMSPGRVVLGDEIDLVTDRALAGIAARTVLFARVGPEQKARIVRALRASGRSVGYLGDGVNDAPALRAADVGISVEGGVDVARESAAVILARKDLIALSDAVAQGRRTFANIIKYIKITVSSNVGNVTSMLAASALLPFLPMLPVQVLVQNLCFDFSQLSIAFDHVDESGLHQPRTFDRSDLARFVACFGLINTLADLATFVMLWRFGGIHDGRSGMAIFRGDWFTENLLTQALAVLVLRSRRGPSLRSRRGPSLRSRTGPSPHNRAAWPVLLGVAGIFAVGLGLPLSPLAPAIGTHAPPMAFFPVLAAVLAGYCAIIMAVRAAYLRTCPRWL